MGSHSTGDLRRVTFKAHFAALSRTTGEYSRAERQTIGAPPSCGASTLQRVCSAITRPARNCLIERRSRNMSISRPTRWTRGCYLERFIGDRRQLLPAERRASSLVFPRACRTRTLLECTVHASSREFNTLPEQSSITIQTSESVMPSESILDFQKTSAKSRAWLGALKNRKSVPPLELHRGDRFKRQVQAE